MLQSMGSQRVRHKGVTELKVTRITDEGENMDTKVKRRWQCSVNINFTFTLGNCLNVINMNRK